MDERDATELAYKNGFEDGLKQFADSLKNWIWLFGGEWCFRESDIDNLLMELTRKEDER